MRLRRALLSVSDKRGIVELGRGLRELGVELISTRGTARLLREAGLDVRTVEEVTGFREILSGRVKTLHPAVHAGILARRQREDLDELAQLDIEPIDLVAVNLYPFAETVTQPDVEWAEALEQIDIGGVTLLRAAAKNCDFVATLCDPADYATVLAELRQGDLAPAKRQRLALKAFRHTAAYDTAVANYLAEELDHDGLFPEELCLRLSRVQSLRYGENPHQEAALYGPTPESTPLGGELLQGKPLSYNNLLDLDAAWRAVSQFGDPTVVIVKHNNPCGVASAETLADAFPMALDSDPISAFGSVIAVNQLFDERTAAAMGGLFVEAIVAPSFSDAARDVLAGKPTCRLLETGMRSGAEPRWELHSVRGGVLLQQPDVAGPEEWQVVSARQPTEEERRSLAFGWRVVPHVRSNAIVLTRGRATVGVGAGQMSRVDAVRLAILKAGSRADGAVLASDAFFPFADGLQEAARAGVTAVIQPGGSLRDEEVIAAADAAGLAMVFTGVRHFRH